MVRPDGTFRSFSFSARKYADGTVDGELQLNSRGFDVFVHIKIDCLRVEGNTAYMSGLITHSSNPEEGVVGELNRWAVQDNGEGSDAEPDRVSSIPENEGNADPKTCEEQLRPAHEQDRAEGRRAGPRRLSAIVRVSTRLLHCAICAS